MGKATLIIAGGGTAGHLFAGIEIAKAWESHTLGAQVVFVGTKRGVEYKLLQETAWPLHCIVIGKLNRVRWYQKIITYVQMPWSFLQCAWICLRYRPGVVCGVGGYASGPMVLIASLLKRLKILNIQTAILEQNAVFGFTNRHLLPWVDKIFTAFPMQIAYPYHRTGNPIRSSALMAEASLQDAPFKVLILGGSQGSVGLNRLVMPLVIAMSKQHAIAFVHQTGTTDYDYMLENYTASCVKNVSVKPFIHDISAAYLDSHVVIARAGASTIFECAAAKKATIFIPLPTAADNHQWKNAQCLVQQQACLCFEQSEMWQKIEAALLILKNEPEKRKQLQEKIAGFYTPDAAKDCVALLSMG